MQTVNMATDNFLYTPTSQITGNDSLDKEAFLKLLVAQLKNQDPLEPMDDKEFISQIAQFSTLESTQNVYAGVNQLKALSLIGKSISATSIYGSGTVAGIVDGVRVYNGNAYVIVDGVDIPVENILTVATGE